jgi:hypothetical protein
MTGANTQLGFDETVELLSNTLPVMALHEHMGQRNVSDSNVNELLDEHGVNRYQITRHIVREILAEQDRSSDEDDIFSLVQSALGMKNPFRIHIRTLLARASESVR